MARWVNLDEMNFYPVELLGDVYEEVSPVVHAHWIINPKYSIVCNCSNCGVAVRGGFGENYCFNCGAKMDEEVE